MLLAWHGLHMGQPPTLTRWLLTVSTDTSIDNCYIQECMPLPVARLLLLFPKK